MADFPREKIEALEKAVGLNPGDARAWANLGWSYLELGNCQQAADAFQRAVELDPT